MMLLIKVKILNQLKLGQEQEELEVIVHFNYYLLMLLIRVKILGQIE